MSKNYRPYAPNQVLLLPPSLHDWLPEGHLSYFISETVDQLNLRRFGKRYEQSGDGTLPYSPVLMVKILLYGYATGVFSSRKIEVRLHEDVAFRVLCANNFPTYRTIARFRRDNGEALAEVFTQVVGIAQESGLLNLGLVAIDGSKVKANASKHKAMSYERMTTEEARLKQEVEDLLARAESIDADEDREYGEDKRGDEIPAELERRESRRAVIKAAKERLEKRHKESQEKDKKDDSDKDGSSPPAKMQENFTDPESRIMKTSNGFEQCYNVQIAVESDSRLIIAAEVTQETNDKKQLLPMVAAVKEETGEKPKEILADSGYRSEPALLELEKQRITGYVALGREQKTVAAINAELLATKRMAKRLEGKRGKNKYRKRKSIVEPVFGWAKSVLGFRSFMLRGFKNVGFEWKLLCTALNLRRMNTMMAWA